MAFTTPDARLVVAYSSVAQLSFITLGIFSLRPTGAQGALLQMVNHGLVTAPLFFIVAALAARAGGSEKLRDMGGIAFRAPVLAALFLIVALATLAMPGSSNFIGEFMILLGRVPGEARDRRSIAFVGRRRRGLLRAAAVHRRDAQPRRAERSPRVRSGLREAAAIVPIVAVILALAFYPAVRAAALGAERSRRRSRRRRRAGRRSASTPQTVALR